MKKINNFLSKYEHGENVIHDDFYKLEKGLDSNKIVKVSKFKQEPKWMREFRLKAYDNFLKIPNPNWGPKLDNYVNFNDYHYYLKATSNVSKTWSDIPDKIKTVFDKIGIIEAEQKFLAGVSTQFESEAIYNSLENELSKLGVIFCDTDTALKKHPKLFKKYFSQIVKNNDNKYASLNSAIWSGGAFIYVPKNVKISKPLQSYFRINSQAMGQFERTLIIVDEGAELHYIEGCTAPIYDSESLHAAVVEIYVAKNAKVRYTTIQNWSDNIINLVTKRAYVCANGTMEWIDGNIGSLVNMKYPSCILAGNNAKGYTLSIAVANNFKMHQDTGAKMIHLANNTKSNIIAKSIAYNGGISNYHGNVYISQKAKNCFAKISCDTLLLDAKSSSKTIQNNINNNLSSTIEHEAKISKISKNDIYYFASKGIDEEEATKMITLGFIDIFAKELPMEYAVELNKLLKLEMDGSIG